MSAITQNNIVSGTRVCTMLGPHKSQDRVTYRLVVNGKTEEVVRKGLVIHCCVKIGTEHEYIEYSHRSAGNWPLTPKLKKTLANLENLKKNVRWTLVSRTLISSPAAPPVAIVKAAPPAPANPSFPGAF